MVLRNMHQCLCRLGVWKQQCGEQNVCVYQNPHVLLPSVTKFINQGLNIIFISHAHGFGCAGESILSLADGGGRGVAQNHFTVAVLKEQDFVAGFEAEKTANLNRDGDLTIGGNLGKIHENHPFFS